MVGFAPPYCLCAIYIMGLLQVHCLKYNKLLGITVALSDTRQLHHQYLHKPPTHLPTRYIIIMIHYYGQFMLISLPFLTILYTTAHITASVVVQLVSIIHISTNYGVYLGRCPSIELYSSTYFSPYNFLLFVISVPTLSIYIPIIVSYPTPHCVRDSPSCIITTSTRGLMSDFVTLIHAISVNVFLPRLLAKYNASFYMLN